MALQSSGQISLSQIATEFKVTPLSIVKLSSFYKVAVGTNKGPVAGVVKTITANANVPSSGQIKFSDFYGAAYYYMQVYFTLTSETKSTYADNDNGTITVYVKGATNNYKVAVNGRTAQNIGTQGGSAYFTGFNSGSYTITVSDNDLNTVGYSFTANIGYNTAASSVNGYTLNDWHDIA